MRRALVVAALAVAIDAGAVTVLTVGKSAVFRRRGDVATAVVRVGRDPAFAALADPTCAGGAVVTLQVAAYPQTTVRVDALPAVSLPCEGWRNRRGGFAYRDPDGAVGGVRTVRYARERFVVRFEGGAYRHVAGPVGYAEVWIEVGGARLVARFHNFRVNEADRIVARRPSAVAAAGEAGFWTVLHGSDHSQARQEETIALLERAVARDRRDGRSAFLLAMLHLYRFGQATVRYDDVTGAAHADLVAANDAFARAVPLLWDGTRGDSRVPGFAAAATFGQGVVDGDAALQAKGLADLESAVAANPFFNVFDLIPVVQALAPSDPRFQQVVPMLASYIADPDTLQCVVTQPEICSDQGLAPRNVAGALLLFGDVYAKAAALDPSYLAQAETWYGIAAFGASQLPGYRFADAVAARVGHAADRAALYQDGDPANDPPLVGAGPEACAVCHYD